MSVEDEEMSSLWKKFTWSPPQIFVTLSIVSFLGSLALPAFYLGKSYLQVVGGIIFLTGWGGGPVALFFWFPNVIYLASLIDWRKDRLPIKNVAVGFAIALSFVFIRNMPLLLTMSEDSVIQGYGLGYSLWLCAFVFLLLAHSARGNLGTKKMKFLCILAVLGCGLSLLPTLLHNGAGNWADF